MLVWKGGSVVACTCLLVTVGDRPTDRPTGCSARASLKLQKKPWHDLWSYCWFQNWFWQNVNPSVWLVVLTSLQAGESFFFFFFKCCNWKVKCVYIHVYLNNIYSSEKLQRGVFNSLIISVQSWLCVSGISHYSRKKKAVEWGRADLRMWWREWQRREKLGQGTRRD